MAKLFPQPTPWTVRNHLPCILKEINKAQVFSVIWCLVGCGQNCLQTPNQLGRHQIESYFFRKKRLYCLDSVFLLLGQKIFCIWSSDTKYSEKKMFLFLDGRCGQGIKGITRNINSLKWHWKRTTYPFSSNLLNAWILFALYAHNIVRYS